MRGGSVASLLDPPYSLFEGSPRHRVPWVSESDSSLRFGGDAMAVIVEVIEWCPACVE
jgi:hypothetical protein